MATPGELVKVIAAVTGEDEATVAHHDRNLVVAGLRTKGGRGRSAATVTARDGAVLLTAVLGSYRVKDSVDTVQRYTLTQEHHSHWHQHFPGNVQGMGRANVWQGFGVPELANLPLSHNFVDAMEVLITLAASGDLIRHFGKPLIESPLRIFATSPGTHARITMVRIGGALERQVVQADYQADVAPPEWVRDPSKPIPDEDLQAAANESPKLKRMTEMEHKPILYVGALLAGELHQMPPIDTT